MIDKTNKMESEKLLQPFEDLAKYLVSQGEELGKLIKQVYENNSKGDDIINKNGGHGYIYSNSDMEQLNELVDEVKNKMEDVGKIIDQTKDFLTEFTKEKKNT